MPLYPYVPACAYRSTASSLQSTTPSTKSPVRGESIPVDKALADLVFAGTLNQTAELECSASLPLPLFVGRMVVGRTANHS